MHSPLAIGILVLAFLGRPQSSLEDLAERAAAEDPAFAAAAIEALRAAGPEGLAAFVAVHRAELASPGTRVAAAIDAIGMQKDNYASRLYWFTDLAHAHARAAAEGKPILSLRLLGNLHEELSCANSRFFRTVLYADPEVAGFLRDNFVLHWQSERPVPKITIDMGDGRSIVRTITGNSIHYVLAADGRVVDGIPGLYGARAFLERLGGARDAAAGDASSAFHERRLAEIELEWRNDLAQAGIDLGALPGPTAATAGEDTGAAAAALRAFGKSKVEAPVLGAMSVAAEELLSRATSDEAWSRIAALHAGGAKLSQASIRLLRNKTLGAEAANRLAGSKALVENPLVRTVAAFERSIAEDTVRNEYRFHAAIHRWLLATPDVRLETLNDRVYAELFLTPRSDPWLGLVPVDTYSALDRGGVVE